VKEVDVDFGKKPEEDKVSSPGKRDAGVTAEERG
jgi:hypothetical protein